MAYGLYSLTTRCLEPMASSRPTMREITEYWGVDGPLPALLGDKSQVRVPSHWMVLPTERVIIENMIRLPPKWKRCSMDNLTCWRSSGAWF